MVALIFVLLILLVIFIKIKMPTWKGRFSERLVYDKLLQLPDEYVIFNNVLFESNGSSTQIDHIVISPYGVFVIETKGYKGLILGGEKSEYWTQVIYKSKHKFYNPILQNDGHVRFLHHLLECGIDIPYIPIVVFNNKAELKTTATQHIVVNRNQLKAVIQQYKAVSLNKETINWIVNIISECGTLADKESNRRHNSNVRSRQHKTRELIERGICPLCGANLVLRKGKYGKFYGCSNYPQCRFTISQ